MHRSDSAAAVAAFLAAPLAALLFETGILAVGPAATLWPFGFVALVALAGLLVGVRIARKASRATGAIVSVPNLLILAYYGFFVLFFGLGGSR